MSLLELRSVDKVFGGLRAVGKLCFSLDKGQIFGLIGPNGAGKTTVFNVITGVYRPDGGQVLFDGEDISGWKPFDVAARGIARTFQNIRLFRSMTVEENVMVAGHHVHKAGVLSAIFRTRTHADDEQALRARALELLEVMNLRDCADHVAGSLPYGSQRRLEIARALMLGPKLVLLDEPAAGMNSQEADALKRQIRLLRDEMGLTVLLVEHNMSVVMSVCDRIHVVDHGETIAEGAPEQIRNDPRVIAAYLGQESDEVAARKSGAPSASSAKPPGANMSDSALEIRDLKVAYGGIVAVKGISLSVARGEIVTLIGANGAGKTSTLKAIVGLVPVASGSIRVFERDIRGTPTHRIVAGGVALVPEGRAIFASMSVRENLELGSFLKREAKGRAERLERCIRLFPRLGERLAQDGGTLSGGEQQMLAIGRALMSDPKLILLDEPSLGLAPKLVEQIFESITEIAKTGITILLVEQNTRLALETAHRAYVLVTGEVALSGNSAELREDPRIRAAYFGEDVEA